VSPVATGIAGVVGGALVAGGYIASRKLFEGAPAGPEPPESGEKEA
jgi:hypothetical protein